MGPHRGLSVRGCFVQTCPFVLQILLHTVHSTSARICTDVNKARPLKAKAVP